MAIVRKDNKGRKLETGERYEQLFSFCDSV